MGVGIHELRAAVVTARQIEEAIKQKYSSYKGWLVLSTPRGQLDAGASVEEILKAFPAMILDDTHKTECFEIRATIERLEAEADAAREPTRQVATKARLEEFRKQLNDTTQELQFDPAVQVEIRFSELKFEEVVWPLQQDPLVDRLRTPQTRASIRIVIGTIGELWSR